MRVVPWGVAVAVLAYVIARVPQDRLMDALAQVSLWRLGVLVVLYVVVLLAVDSLALWMSFKVSLPDAAVPYAGVVQIRGASHLLAQVSYAAGQGGVVYLLWQGHRVPAARGAGAVLLGNAAFILVMALATAVGLVAGAVPDQPELRVVALAVVAALPLYLAVIAWRPGLLARRQLLEPFFRAGARGSAKVAAVRAVHLAVLITGHLFAMRLFGVDVPVAVALAGLPVLFLVAALPISPSGLGTTQAAAMTLFGAFAPGSTGAARDAVVVAYSLSFQVTATVLLLAIGVVCLRAVGRPRPDLSAGSPGRS